MRKGVRRLLLTVVATLLVIGLAAPYIQANHFKSQIREGLERGLNRKVEIGTVRFNLFTGPGFTVEDVIIYDDPSAGIEPFAHMLELEARVRLSALLTGRIEFARLRFVEPSVNLVKPAAARWNIAPLLERTVEAGSVPGVAMPEIQVTEGRIFFKFGDKKSPFYFLNADVVIAPRSSEKGAFLVQFTGEPASTNRGATGSGEFSARGRLLTSPTGPSRLEVDLALDEGDIDDIITLIRGESLGMHGRIGSQAKLWGPIGNLELLGSLAVENVHRWDRMPQRAGSLNVRYRGTMDLASQTAEVKIAPPDNPGLPAEARLVVSDIIFNPRWSAELNAGKLPASALVNAARHLGVPIPREMEIKGEVAGAFGYTSELGLQGRLAVDGVKVQLAGGPDLEVGAAAIVMNGSTVHLTPATLTGPGRTAELEAIYSPTQHRFEAILRGTSLRIAELKAGGLVAAGAAPLIERFSGGTWSGWVRHVSEPGSPTLFTASIGVRDTTTRIPGIADPLDIQSAEIELDGADVSIRRMRVKTGEIEAAGDYRYVAEGNKHTFTLSIPTLSGVEVERVFTPAARPQKGNFLTRTFNWNRRDSSDSLAVRNAEGEIKIGDLMLGEIDMHDVRSHLVWDGSSVRFPNIEGRVLEGAFTGEGSVDLKPGEPRYLLRGKLANAAWGGGKLDLTGTLETAGTGLDLLLNLRTSGKFQARSLEIDPDYPMRTVSGDFGFGFSKLLPRLTLTALQVAVGSERFLGQGATQADGRLQLELASASRVMHVSGPVVPLRLEVTTDRTPLPPR